MTIPYNEGIYFITFTCSKWLPLIEMTNGYRHVYKWYDYLKIQGHFVLGYVIMPNHVHSIIAFRSQDSSNSSSYVTFRYGKSINNIISNGKRFMAYAIVADLKALEQFNLLSSLANGVNTTQQAMGKKHEVFEPSFDWKECGGLHILCQKLDYIHQNPCKGNSPLANSQQDYRHSSASYYLTGVHSEYEVTDYMNMKDIDLTKGG
ncbi:MAG: hypothetical protein QM610_14595 [Chitinophagaceae bacterium]